MKDYAKIWVVVAPLVDPGLKGCAKVVKEGTLSRCHTEADGAVQVPHSPYYMRKIRLGELKQVEGPHAVAAVDMPSAARTMEDTPVNPFDQAERPKKKKAKGASR